MKSLSLDSLRRFITRRRKKDKIDPPSAFERSDSFKRISIKKNYLDRGGKGRGGGKTGRIVCGEKPVESAHREKNESESVVIDYGEWIRCIQKEDKVSKSPLRSSFNVSTDSVLQRSPPPTPKRISLGLKGSSDLEDGGNKTDSAISVSLGRIWMDAPLTMTNAPRSLELPKPVSAIELNPNGQRAHHSLESALKNKKEDKAECSGYLSKPPAARSAAFARGHAYKNSSEMLSSSKDSGFSFSISIPRLSPVMSHADNLFRKKKQPTSQTRKVVTNRTPSNCNELDRKHNRRRQRNDCEHSGPTYQAVVDRPAKTTKATKLDPIIFVPPQRRKWKMKKAFEVQEIREYCSPCDERLRPEDRDDADELYAVISEEIHDEVKYEARCRSTELWTTDAEDSEEFEVELISKCNSPAQQANYSPHCKRKPVMRKKSIHKIHKNARYVARPIYRVPSTLKHTRKLVKKNISDTNQKGCEKKRGRLLVPYQPKETQASESSCGDGKLPLPTTSSSSRSGVANAGQSVISVSPNTRSRRRRSRRLTRNENNCHDEVKKEAVQQVLVVVQNQTKPSLPMPLKRTSVGAKSPHRTRNRSVVSSSDNESVGNHNTRKLDRPRVWHLPSQSGTSSTGSSRDKPSQHRQHNQRQQIKLPNRAPTRPSSENDNRKLDANLPIPLPPRNLKPSEASKIEVVQSLFNSNSRTTCM